MVVHGLTGMQERADEAGGLLDWAFREYGNFTICAPRARSWARPMSGWALRRPCR